MQDIIRLDLGRINSYLLPVNEGFVLVDTGGYTFNDKQLNNKRAILEQKLHENGCVPGKLKVVILTHGDIDHIANGGFLKEKYGTKVILHKDDSHLIHDLSVEKVFSNFKFQSMGFKFMAFLMSPLFKRLTRRIINEFEEFEADELITAGYDLKQYNLDADIIHLPGHTKGSIGILTKNGSLISGDTLVNVKKPSISINALDFTLMKKSITSLLSLNIKTVYPGHGDPFPFSRLKI